MSYIFHKATSQSWKPSFSVYNQCLMFSSQYDSHSLLSLLLLKIKQPQTLLYSVFNFTQKDGYKNRNNFIIKLKLVDCNFQ